MRTAIYARVNTLIGQSPEMQLAELRAYASRRGWEIFDEYVDSGVSGWMFRSFGLRPALGRLLSDDDDREPGAHSVVVLSYDYWTRCFGRNPKVVGSTVRITRKYGMGSDIFEIVGVASSGFNGTEVGTATALFVPAMMHPLVSLRMASLFRVFAPAPARTGCSGLPVKAIPRYGSGGSAKPGPSPLS